MAGLLGLLDLGADAFTAQNAGVAVAGRNLANVNTLGYSVESVDLEAQLGAPLVGGVTVGDPRRADSPLLSARERLAAGSYGMSDAQAAALGDLEGRLTGEGTDVAQAIGGLFGAAGQLAAAPLDDSLRQALVAAAQKLADALQRAQDAVAESTSAANQCIADYATQANQLAAQIAAANKSLAQSNDPVIADQRDLAAKQLAELTGGQARIDADGQMRFVVGSGTVLVDGARAATVQAAGDPADPTRTRVQVVDGNHVADVTATLDQRVKKVIHEDQYARVFTGDANVVVHELRRQVTNLGPKTLSLAFIDPPGTQIRFESIKALSEKLPMDLLINFPLGMNINRQHWHRRAAGDDEFDAYFGTSRWRDARDGRELLALYKEQLQTLGYRCMDSDLTIRNRRKNQRLYVLILASKHPRGDEFWKKATHRDSIGQESLFKLS